MDGRNFLTKEVGLHFCIILVQLISMVNVKSVLLKWNNESKLEFLVKALLEMSFLILESN